jgi:hypothetical protein
MKMILSNTAKLAGGAPALRIGHEDGTETRVQLLPGNHQEQIMAMRKDAKDGNMSRISFDLEAKDYNGNPTPLIRYNGVAVMTIDADSSGNILKTQVNDLVFRDVLEHIEAAADLIKEYLDVSLLQPHNLSFPQKEAIAKLFGLKIAYK